MKKWLSMLVAGCMTVTLMSPMISAAEDGQGRMESGEQESSLTAAPLFKDLSGHWSQSAVAQMKALELMNGYGDQQFKPNRTITRAELVVVLDRAFGFTGEGKAKFADVADRDWYYSALMRANGSGIIQGTNDGHLSPEQLVSREDAAVMIDRAFGLSREQEDESGLKKFSDQDSISPYATKALAYLVNEQVLRGYNGKLQPKAPITRAEIAVLLSSMIADIVTAPTQPVHNKVKGNVIIRSNEAALKGIEVEGNLVLAEGIRDGSIQLEDVSVTGNVLIKGGRTVNITGSKLNQVTLDKQGAPAKLVIADESKLSALTVLQQADIELSANSSAGTVRLAGKAEGSTLLAKGSITELIVEADNVMVNGKEAQSGSHTSIQPEGDKAPAVSGGSVYVPATGSDKPVAATTIPDNQWELVWKDEFNGTQVDSSKWSVMDTGLVYNNELQYYSPNNVSIVKDQQRSVLQIEAKRGGKEGEDYTSGKLISMGKGDWTYGKVVVRAKLPIQQGMWPAIWMMPTDEAHYGGWPASGEIDIMELIGGEQGKGRIYSTIHYDSVQPDGSHGHEQGSTTLANGKSFADEYHDFQVEWLPGVIRFYVDGQLHHEVTDWQTKAIGQPEYYTYPAPFDRPFYLILNLAVGGDWPGSPNQDFQSETMKVDFVRVYSYKNLKDWPDVTNNPPKPVQQREPQADGNQIYNHAFTGEVGAEGVPSQWQLLTNADGAGSVEIVDDKDKGKAAKVSITNQGTQNYSVQLTQMPMYMLKNRKYKVTFDAKASANRNIMSKVNQFQKDWKNYSGEQNFALTTEWKSYEYTFNMRAGSDNNARFEFNLGLNTDTVYLANVRLVDIGEADSLVVERKALPDGNLIYNGTFDQGKQRLGFWTSHIAQDAAASVSVNNFLKFPIMERQLVVHVTDTNGAPDQVAVVQPDVPLEANTTYGFSFDAKADAPRSMELDVVSSEGNLIKVIKGKEFNLGTEMRSFTGEITVGDGAMALESELRLLFGGEKGTVYVDNVRLVKRGHPISVDGYAHVAATDAWTMQGLQVEASSEGGKHVGYMDEGDLLQYKLDVARDAQYMLSARMASGKTSSTVRFSMKDEQGQTVVQSVLNLGDSGGWQTYKTVYFPAALLKAGHSYYVDFEGVDYNTLWIDISENKLQNAGFASDLAPWALIPGSLQAARSEQGELQISLPDKQTKEEWWDSLLQQGNLRLEAGKHYRLEFDAYASAARSLHVAVSQSSGQYTKYLDQQLQLSKDKQRYSYTFGMGNESDAAAVLAIGLGQGEEALAAHTVALDKITLFEVNPSADQGGQPVHVNLIANGSFVKGTEGWFSYVAGNDQSQLKMNAVNGQLQVHVGDVGNNPWDRQVIYEGFAMKQGSSYKVTFKAKADKARKLGLGIGWVDAAANYEYHGYYGAQVDLTEEEQVYTFTFDVTADSYPNTRLAFDLGNITGAADGQTVVTLSDVSLIHLGPAQ